MASEAAEATEAVLCVGDRGRLRRRRGCCSLPYELGVVAVGGRGEEQSGTRRTLRLVGGWENSLGIGRKEEGLRQLGDVRGKRQKEEEMRERR